MKYLFFNHLTKTTSHETQPLIPGMTGPAGAAGKRETLPLKMKLP